MKIVTLVSFHMLNHLRKILKLISYSFLRYLYQSNMAVTCHPTAMYFEYNSHFVWFFFQIAVWQQQCNDSYKDLNVVFILNLCKSNMASTIYLRIIMKTVVGKCIWRFPFWKIEDPSIQININTLQNMACHTGTHYQDNSPVALSLLKKLKFVWRLDTRWFYPQVPDILMGWGDLTTWEDCSVAIPMAHWSHNPLVLRRTYLRLRVQ